MTIDQIASYLTNQLQNAIYFRDVDFDLVPVGDEADSGQRVPLTTFIENLTDPVIKELFTRTVELLVIIKESDQFIESLSKGELTVEPPKNNLIVSSYKQLHANLNHLVWQVQRISEGDLNQKIDFLGDFSLYFNKLITSLQERERIQKELIASEERYRQINIELEELNRTKDKFISILAHDLKNPFNALMGFSQSLLDNYDSYDKEALRPYIEIINNTSRKTYNLLEELLEWATAQQGQIRVNPQPIILAKSINECISLLSANIENKQIGVTNSVSEELCVYSDFYLLRTICRNLLTNAVKFSHKNGEIRIDAKVVEKMVEITISDRGVGMDRGAVESLFKIGETTPKEGTDGERGSGFGLLLCKEFVEKQGGTISAKSKIGEGSQFSFTVPHCNDSK